MKYGRIVVAIALLATACTSSQHTSVSSASAPPTSVSPVPGVRTACATSGRATPVEVTLRMVGGVPPGLNKPVPGSVVAVTDSGSQCSIAVGEKSAARLDLSPGVYTITGRSPTFGDGKYECSAANRVTVFERPSNSRGGPVLVAVVCPVR